MKDERHTLDYATIEKIYPTRVVHCETGCLQEVHNRECFGISFCTKGQITYTMNGKTYVSNPENAIVLPKGVSYSAYCDAGGNFPVINFECRGFESEEILVFPMRNPQVFLNYFENLNRLFGGDSRFKLYIALYEILDKLWYDKAYTHNYVQESIRYIDANISNPELSNSSIAKAVGISEGYLRKLFLKIYKTTPKQYILNIRMNKAMQMVIDTSYAMATIAEECGFSNPYHFCRSFKEKTGMTPTEYGKRYGGRRI